MEKKCVYKVMFNANGALYEVYARSVETSQLLGFLEIGSLLFGKNSTLVVDPNEERLKNEFQGVRKSYIPIASILRIDAVDEEGTAKIQECKFSQPNVMPFPGSYHHSPGTDPTPRKP